MKREQEDIDFGNLLKGKLPAAGENEWFTRKVMNRLPEKHHSYLWVERCIYAVCILVCLVGWVLFIGNQNFNVIMVKDVVNFGVMTGVTLVLLWQTLRKFMTE